MEIKINKLTKTFGDLIAVNEISFKIESKGVFALLGVNGAGKTTTIKMLTGLLCKDAGEVFYGNLSIDDDLEKIKENINISPQETAVADNLTVKENIEFIAQIYGMEKDKVSHKTKEVIDSFGLNEVQNVRANKLSGGMKRRLSIAMALVTNPKVLFLDEPTLGLDVLARAELWKLIIKLKKDMTIVLTTHYMEEAEVLADNIAIMSNGNIVAMGSVAELKNSVNAKSLEQAFIKIVGGEK